MHKYRVLRHLGEGTFSEVLKAESVKTRQKVAIKCMKSHFTKIEQVQNLREIKALQRLSPHPHIIQLIEVLYDEPTGRLALVFELMEMNLYEAIKGRTTYLPESRVKFYIYQLLKAIEHMHKNGIFHRDIKPENILLSGDTIKLADLGSCRGLYSKPPLTEYISTRWYRAPECLMTDGHYGYKMDVWGVGCVFFEILSLFPLFPGDNELDQIHKIHSILGTPDPAILADFQKNATHMKLDFEQRPFVGISKLVPNVSAEAQSVIMKMLIYEADKRVTASQVLRSDLFKELRELEMGQLTAGPQGFNRSNVIDNSSQYSRRNSDDASDPGASSTNIGTTHKSNSLGPIAKKAKVNMNHSISGAGASTFGQNSFYKAGGSKPTVNIFNSVNKSDQQKKALPAAKKFPELKNLGGDNRNHNNSLSSDDDVFNVSQLRAKNPLKRASFDSSDVTFCAQFPPIKKQKQLLQAYKQGVAAISKQQPPLNKNAVQAIQIHQNQKIQMQTQYHPHGLSGLNNVLNGGGQTVATKGFFKKKPIAKQGMSNSPKQNGMLAALHPSGTMRVVGGGIMGTQNSTISTGMMSTDFRSTMKHNSSNNSIHSHGHSPHKKMINSSIRKPTEQVVQNKFANKGSASGSGGGNYMSPYSQKIATKNPGN